MYPPKQVLSDYLKFNAKKISTIEKILNNIEDFSHFMFFSPSRTAQNGLNFITKEDEMLLCSLPYDENNENIFDMFRFIYILLNEEFSNFKSEKIIPNLFNVIMPKYNSSNLKHLFEFTICTNLNISLNQYHKIEGLLKKNNKFFFSHIIFKISKPASYLTFIIKEIYEFIRMRTDKGEMVLFLRQDMMDLDLLKQNQKKIGDLLK